MNTFIWIAIVLIAWTRPIDIYYRVTKKVNGRIVKQRDYVKLVAWLAAIILLILGLVK